MKVINCDGASLLSVRRQKFTSLFGYGGHITHFQDSEEIFLRFLNLITEIQGFYNVRNSNTGSPLFGQADHENSSNFNRKAVGIRLTLNTIKSASTKHTCRGTRFMRTHKIFTLQTAKFRTVAVQTDLKRHTKQVSLSLQKRNKYKTKTNIHLTFLLEIK
jgi:hypothetical protein